MFKRPNLKNTSTLFQTKMENEGINVNLNSKTEPTSTQVSRQVTNKRVCN